MTLFYLGAIILIGQHIADAALTYRIITSGKGTEANPVSRAFIRWFGNAGLFVEKLIIAPVIYVAWITGDKGLILIWILVAFSCAVLWNNWRVLNGGKGLLG